MGVSYADFCEMTISARAAERSIRAHCATLDEYAEKLAEFHVDCGDLPEYEGQTVADWLGY